MSALQSWIACPGHPQRQNVRNITDCQQNYERKASTQARHQNVIIFSFSSPQEQPISQLLARHTRYPTLQHPRELFHIQLVARLKLAVVLRVLLHLHTNQCDCHRSRTEGPEQVQSVTHTASLVRWITRSLKSVNVYFLDDVRM